MKQATAMRISPLLVVQVADELTATEKSAALGQRRRSQQQEPVSGLPSIADVPTTSAHFGLGPRADSWPRFAGLSKRLKNVLDTYRSFSSVTFQLERAHLIEIKSNL